MAEIQKSRTVGVVLPEISNLFNMKIVAVFERVLQENGYSVIVTDCQNNLEQEASSVDFLLKKQVDGIINVPIGSSSRHLRPAVEKKVPILLLDRPLEDLNGVASCVLIDNRGAARLGVRRLLQAGHRRIGVLVGSDEVHTAQMRLRGYRDALEEYGVEYDESLVRRCDLTLEGGYRQARRLLKANTGMTAMFLTNYDLTLGALIALNERGVQIPGEMSVVGFDNIMDLSPGVPALADHCQPAPGANWPSGRPADAGPALRRQGRHPHDHHLSRFPKRGRLGGGASRPTVTVSIEKAAVVSRQLFCVSQANTSILQMGVASPGKRTRMNRACWPRLSRETSVTAGRSPEL